MTPERIADLASVQLSRRLHCSKGVARRALAETALTILCGQEGVSVNWIADLVAGLPPPLQLPTSDMSSPMVPRDRSELAIALRELPERLPAGVEVLDSHSILLLELLPPHLTVQAVSRALRQAGYFQCHNGMPVRIGPRLLRLWAVGPNRDHWIRASVPELQAQWAKQERATVPPVLEPPPPEV